MKTNQSAGSFFFFFFESYGSASMKLKNSILNKPLKKIFKPLTVIKTFCIMI